MQSNSQIITPGILEIYCGPMNSCKTRELINRLDRFERLTGHKYTIFKPDLDTRDSKIKSRFGELSYDCTFTKYNKPEEILKKVNGEDLVIIDEVQFYSEGIEKTIEKLLLENTHVIAAGLDLDFRGEPFGRIPQLLALADIVHKVTAVCDYNECNNPATRTQRLIDGNPANYDSPTVLVGDRAEGYESRCLKHHFVPGKP